MGHAGPFLPEGRLYSSGRPERYRLSGRSIYGYQTSRRMTAGVSGVTNHYDTRARALFLLLQAFAKQRRLSRAAAAAAVDVAL
eukprot:scaffold182838_cov30-Prasinocladus_malaysianus.AAC.1